MSVSETKIKPSKKKIAKQVQNEQSKAQKKQPAKGKTGAGADSKSKSNAFPPRKMKRKITESEGKGPPKKKKKKQERPANKIAHQDGAPNWRQIRTDAADIRQRRKAHHKMFEVGQHMKQLWEELRTEKCAEDRKQTLLRELAGLVRGRVPQLVRAHDRARVCETLIQLGDAGLREALFAEVKDVLLELSKDKYARHFVLKILSYGSDEQKAAIGEAFRGRVPALLGHKFSGEIVEEYFREVASPETQQRMAMEFYGPEFSLSSEKTTTLAQLLQARPERRALALANVRAQLQSLLDKQLLTGSLSHRLLREYLSECSERERPEVIESLREAVVQMLHTKDGARVALHCLWWGTAKDRKAIVKSLKTYVQKVCTDEHGFMVMLAILDVVDDTRLVKKALLEELLSNVVEILATEHGKKVVHYLVSPRDTTYFHPKLVAELSAGDANATSKKDAEVRRREILEAVAEPLLRTASIHCLEWMADSTMCIPLTDILTKCNGPSLQLPLSQLAKKTAEPMTSQTDSHLVNNSAAYMQLKKLIQADKQRAAAATGDQPPVLFSTLILRELTEEAVLSWFSTNRTAFLFVIMLETEVEAVTSAVVSRLQPFMKKLKPSCKGAEILKKKLKTLASTEDS